MLATSENVLFLGPDHDQLLTTGIWWIVALLSSVSYVSVDMPQSSSIHML